MALHLERDLAFILNVAFHSIVVSLVIYFAFFRIFVFRRARTKVRMSLGNWENFLPEKIVDQTGFEPILVINPHENAEALTRWITQTPHFTDYIYSNFSFKTLALWTWHFSLNSDFPDDCHPVFLEFLRALEDYRPSENVAGKSPNTVQLFEDRDSSTVYLLFHDMYIIACHPL